MVGALALYWIGALLGRERTLAIAAKLPLVKVSDIEKTEAWFLKHGKADGVLRADDSRSSAA